jgi:divalent metal cation (Fe/Co/Zn/Cd) transporter
MRNVGVNYLIIAVSLLFEAISWGISIRELNKDKKPHLSYLQAIRKGKDPSMFLVVLEDSAALLGLLAALTGIYLASWTGNPIYDGAASVVIGLILGGTAIFIAQETKGLLVGEAASREVVQTLNEIVTHVEHVEHVNEILTLHMGPEFIIVTISLDFADDMPAGELERAVLRLQEEITRRIPEVQRVFVEAEPWGKRTMRREAASAGGPTAGTTKGAQSTD